MYDKAAPHFSPRSGPSIRMPLKVLLRGIFKGLRPSMNEFCAVQCSYSAPRVALSFRRYRQAHASQPSLARSALEGVTKLVKIPLHPSGGRRRCCVLIWRLWQHERGEGNAFNKLGLIDEFWARPLLLSPPLAMHFGLSLKEGGEAGSVIEGDNGEKTQFETKFASQ